jgi:hypothetical protein
MINRMDNQNLNTNQNNLDEFIDLKLIFKKLISGTTQSIAFSLLGLVIATLLFLVYTNFSYVVTSTRLVVSFKGSNAGIYPDKSKFSYTDIVSSDIVHDALREINIEGNQELEVKIKRSLSIEGIIPTELVKQRDRLISSGQTLPPVIPSEFNLTLNLPRTVQLTTARRRQLLISIINMFKLKFERTYATPPIALGNLSNLLLTSDYDDFERILADNSNRIESYLFELHKEAGSFRSGRTKLSFGDLINENQDFNQIYKNKTLGLIHEGKIAKNRKAAILKMNYKLYELSNLEKKQIEEEKSSREYLDEVARHTSSYILGVKSQITNEHNNTPILDKDLIDSLVANDTYSFILKKALDASLKLKNTQVEQIIIADNLKSMQAALDSEIDKQLNDKANESVIDLIKAYDTLVHDIRDTYSDYATQEFSDTIRLSAPIETESIWRALLIPSLAGLGLGAALGMGLSLVDINLYKARKE